MRTILRRFTWHYEPRDGHALSAEHRAVRLGTSLFREGRLRFAEESAARILKSGHNNRKIGAEIVKGKWKGFPVFTLTLEERATCPRACKHWLDCYGNKMNWPYRWHAEPALIERLEAEIFELASTHNDFVIRLHVLGDFYSVEYVRQWERWLDQFPGLHVYGYSAWAPETEIGGLIADLAENRWDRFAVRTSNGNAELRTTRTLYSDDAAIVEDGIVCPAQTGKTECCGTCGLCWQTQRRIVFLVH